MVNGDQVHEYAEEDDPDEDVQPVESGRSEVQTEPELSNVARHIGIVPRKSWSWIVTMVPLRNVLKEQLDDNE